MKVEDVDYIKQMWGVLSLTEIAKNLSMDIIDVVKIAYQSKLSKVKTPDIGRRWTKEEDDFLKEYANSITIPEACNLLYRSRYATYQRVKRLNLEQMIGK